MYKPTSLQVKMSQTTRRLVTYQNIVNHANILVGGWPYCKWYHSLSSKMLPHFYVKDIFLAQKLQKLEEFKENLSKFQKKLLKL